MHHSTFCCTPNVCCDFCSAGPTMGRAMTCIRQWLILLYIWDVLSLSNTSDICATRSAVTSFHAWEACVRALPYDSNVARQTSAAVIANMANYALLDDSPVIRTNNGVSSTVLTSIRLLAEKQFSDDFSFHSALQSLVRQLHNPFTMYYLPMSYAAVAFLPFTVRMERVASRTVVRLQRHVLDDLDLTAMFGYDRFVGEEVSKCTEPLYFVFQPAAGPNHRQCSSACPPRTMGCRQHVLDQRLSCTITFSNKYGQCNVRMQIGIVTLYRTASFGGICWLCVRRAPLSGAVGPSVVITYNVNHVFQ